MTITLRTLSDHYLLVWDLQKRRALLYHPFFFETYWYNRNCREWVGRALKNPTLQVALLKGRLHETCAITRDYYPNAWLAGYASQINSGHSLAPNSPRGFRGTPIQLDATPSFTFENAGITMPLVLWISVCISQYMAWRLLGSVSAREDFRSSPMRSLFQ